ncbi:MAG: D-hexose-6-phosphate mutarotase [Hydrogenophaga sp.]|nr:D-hexose-6-phosphate mutarotase [Hydrogenophaga sp.]
MPDTPTLHTLDGPGGLPLLQVDNRHASARLSLQGAQLLGYQPAGAPEALFVSPNAVFAPGQPIRGGVPVCWPWFGPDPEGRGRPAHGFARNRLWALRSATHTDDGATELRLGLTDDAATRALWPHAFDLELAVTVGPALRLALTTRNTGGDGFTLTQALHSYFAVGDIAAVQVQGLDGCRYIDKVAGASAPLPRQAGPVVFDGQVDRIYQGVPPGLQVVDAAAGRRIALRSEGSTTAVVWNPGAALAATMADLGAGAHRGYVCVETANAGDEVIAIAPGASHRMAVVIDTRAG